MTKEELIDRINDIEWEDFEAKEAKSELPKNIWETVSAFANTSGGWIVLGIKQNGKKFEISGVDNAEKLEQDFQGTLRSQKFNEPVDAKSMLYHIDGHKVLAFHIASSPHKPIYYNNPQNTFIRFGSGDQRATNGEITAIFHNQSFGIKSEQILLDSNLSMLNEDTIRDYRNYFKLYSPRPNLIGNDVTFESDICTSTVTFWLDSDRASDRASDKASDRAEDDTYIDATDKVVSILRFCKEAKFRKKIFELLGVTYQFKNFKAFIEPLLQHDYLELTVPDKPTSPKQQYRTTKKGLLFLETV